MSWIVEQCLRVTGGEQRGDGRVERGTWVKIAKRRETMSAGLSVVGFVLAEASVLGKLEFGRAGVIDKKGAYVCMYVCIKESKAREKSL